MTAIMSPAQRLAKLLDLRARVELEIAAILDKPTRRRRVNSPCGTDSGYYRHRRNQEPTCELCRRAHTLANRKRRGKTP